MPLRARLSRSDLGLIGLGLLLIITTWWGIHVKHLSGWYFVQFAVYLPAVVLVLRRGESFGRWAIGFLLLVALTTRVLFLFSTPSLSTDLYRYIWDGKLFNFGWNPYLYPADAVELVHLRGPLWEGIDHKWTYTVYPPVSELAYAIAYWFAGESFIGMQAMGFLADLGVVALIGLLLRTFGFGLDRILIYAWSPLPPLHYVHSGHHDPLMMFFLLLSLLLLVRGRSAASGAAFAASVLAKLHTAVLAPVFLRSWGWRGVLGGLVATLALYLPFLSGGPEILRGVTSEAGGVIFNDGGQFLIRWFVQLFVEDGRAIARYIAGLIMLAAGVYFLLRPDPRLAALWQRSYFLLGLLLLVAPMVQPWYLGWILPFLCFALRPGTGWFPVAVTPGLGFLLWTGTIGLTDLAYGNNTPYLWWYLRAIQYVPLALIIAWAAARSEPALFLWRHPRHRSGRYGTVAGAAPGTSDR